MFDFSLRVYYRYMDTMDGIGYNVYKALVLDSSTELENTVECRICTYTWIGSMVERGTPSLISIQYFLLQLIHFKQPSYLYLELTFN